MTTSPLQTSQPMLGTPYTVDVLYRDNTISSRCTSHWTSGEYVCPRRLPKLLTKQRRPLMNGVCLSWSEMSPRITKVSINADMTMTQTGIIIFWIILPFTWTVSVCFLWQTLANSWGQTLKMSCWYGLILHKIIFKMMYDMTISWKFTEIDLRIHHSLKF
jgi:hypothetical protein